MNNKIKNMITIFLIAGVGAFLARRSFGMGSISTVTFMLGLSLFSMLIIVGAALMGAYKFLKSVGLFKGHYYY
jgi:hypothetical protein